MKYTSLFILFASAMIFAACDGRDRLHKTPQEILHETELLDSFSENSIYIPAGYAEKITDTIFSNGYNIHIKMYSDLENYITVISGKETTNYRDFSLYIKVIKDGKIIMDKTFNKQHHMIYESASIDLKTSYLRDFWISIDDKHYKDKNTPVINFEYYSPISKETEVMSVIALDGRYDFEVN